MSWPRRKSVIGQAVERQGMLRPVTAGELGWLSRRFGRRYGGVWRVHEAEYIGPPAHWLNRRSFWLRCSLLILLGVVLWFPFASQLAAQVAAVLIALAWAIAGDVS